MRTYELAIVADPRLSEEEFVALVDETKSLVASRGGELVREESWGKRKLAYPIEKLTEGRYTFLYLQMEPAKAALLPEVELRLKQNDNFLTVRTDEDMKRAVSRAKPGVPVRTIYGEPTAEAAVGAPADLIAEPARDAGEEE
jgi:small subunit ribosomal protein S6